MPYTTLENILHPSPSHEATPGDKTHLTIQCPRCKAEMIIDGEIEAAIIKNYLSQISQVATLNMTKEFTHQRAHHAAMRRWRGHHKKKIRVKRAYNIRAVTEVECQK